MSIVDKQIVTNNINEFGSSITLTTVSVSLGTDEYRTPTETTANYSLTAFPQVLTTEDDIVIEGQFAAGDFIFWFSADNISYLSNGNRITYNSKLYEINDVIRHDVADILQVVEVRTKKR